MTRATAIAGAGGRGVAWHEATQVYCSKMGQLAGVVRSMLYEPIPCRIAHHLLVWLEGVDITAILDSQQYELTESC